MIQKSRPYCGVACFDNMLTFYEVAMFLQNVVLFWNPKIGFLQFISRSNVSKMPNKIETFKGTCVHGTCSGL